MSETETNECPVCLEPAPQSKWCALRECRHGLCETCAVTLITTQGQSRCPLCRIEILTCPVMVFAEDQPRMKVRWDAAHAGQSDALVATLWRTYETDVDNWSTYLRAIMLQNMGIEPSTDPVVVAHFARLQTAARLNVARIRDEWMRMHEDEFHVDDINHLPLMNLANVAAYIALAAARKGTRNWLLHLVAEIPVANILALLAEGPHRARRSRVWWRITLPLALACQAITLLAPSRASSVLATCCRLGASGILAMRARWWRTAS